MRIARYLLVPSVLLTAVLCAACGGAPAPEPEPAPEPAPDWAMMEARDAARTLQGKLSHHLIQEMRHGGTMGAIKVCAELAQEISRKQSRPGFSVRRVTLKPRNPADTPDAFERKQLEWLEDLYEQRQMPKEIVDVVTEDGQRRLRYLKPLMITKVCLNCHGMPEQMEPEVVEFLAQNYPDDQAVGYTGSEVRGAISVKIDLN